MMTAVAVRLAVLVLVSALVVPLVAAQTSWSSVTIQSVTSANCTASGNGLTNCPFPAVVVITTSGYGGLLTRTYGPTIVLLTAADGTENWNTVQRYSGDTGANTTLQATLMPSQYDASFVAAAAGAVPPLVNMSIRALQGGGGGLGVTVAVPLISFAYDAGPTLSSISGCTGSGAVTTGCDPASAVLTFTGSGFRWFSNPGAVQLWLGTSYSAVTGQGGGPGQAALQVQSDSQLTVNLSTAYVYLLLPTHYGGAQVSVFFNEPRNTFGTQINAYTNSLAVAFIPQPAAVVSNVWIGGNSACQGTNGTGPYTGCVPLVSYINIGGAYMYDVNVTVGGVPCAQLVTVSSSFIRCLLPQLTGGGSYDLVVSDQNAATVVYTTDYGLISFASGPTVASVTTCTNTGATNNQGFWFGGLCSEGALITVTGTNFVAGDSTVVVQFSRSTGGQSSTQLNVTCLSPSVLTSTTITCTLPYLAAQTPSAVTMYGSNVQLRVYFSSQPAVTNALTLQLYNFPYAPQVTGLTSQPQYCQPAPGLYEYNCGPAALLTITGSNLYNGTNVQVVPVAGGPYSWSCTVSSTQSTQLVCALPSFDAQVSPVQVDTLFAMVVCVQQAGTGGGGNNGGPNNACGQAANGPGGGGSWVPSNAFYLSFNLGTSVTSWSQVALLSVSSPNCTLSGGVLTQCVLPTQLLITTSGYGSLNVQQADLIVVAPDGTEIGYGFGQTSGMQMSRASSDLGQNVYLQATIYPSQYTPSIMGASASAAAPVCNLTIEGYWQGDSPAAPLISFAYDGPPTLTSVSGCTGSGTATSACVPATSVLTFTGSGFRWFSNPGAVQVWLGTSYSAVTGQGGGPGQAALQVQSDTQMTLNLATSYVYLLLPTHYGGAAVSIFFNERRWSGSPMSGAYVNSYTNSLAVAFIPQPAPVVSNVWIGGNSACQGTNGTGPYTGCVPLVSYINIGGAYMYDVSVTVGGAACAQLVTVSAAMVRCVLPLLSATGPYDLVVSDPNAATAVYTTDSGLISYVSGPTISSVTTCTNTGATNWQGLFFGGLCYAGSSITVSGNNFLTGDSSVTVNFTWTPSGPWWQRPAYGRVPITVLCQGPSVLSATAISCTLPDLTQQTGAAANASLVMYNANVAVQVSFAQGATSTNALQLTLYNYPNAPIVSSVSGCGLSNSALSLSNCASGNVLTITGTNLFNGSWVVVTPLSQGFADWACQPLSYGSTQITCELPVFDPQVSPVTAGSTYTMNVNVEQSGFGIVLERSNAFYIDFGGVVSSSAASSSSHSGLSTGAIVAIAVVVPIVAVLLAVVLAVTCRRYNAAGLPQLGKSKATAFGKHVDEPTSDTVTTADVEIA